MFNNFEAWNEIYKNQQNMMKSWSELLKNPSVDGAFNNFTFPNFNNYPNLDFLKQQQQMMEMWKEFAEGNIKNFEDIAPQLEKWQDLMKNYNFLEAGQLISTSTGDLFEKMMNSNQFYLNLYKIWQELSENLIEPSSKEFKEQLEKVMTNYDKMLMENFIPLFPSEIQSLFINPYNYIKTVTRSFYDFYNPWEDISKEISNIYMKAMITNDPSKLSDALSLWKEGYNRTFGALIKSPVLGSSREAIEQNNKMIDALINFLIISGEFLTKINNVANIKSKEAFKNYFELLKEGAEPKTFNEFYKFWSSKVEKALNKYFYTDEFSKIISFTADAALKFKMEADKTTEKLLENYPIVTKSEVDGVYKNVYNLKKEVKMLKKEIDNLNEIINSKDYKNEKKETSSNLKNVADKDEK